ncbi:hypothetical protein CCHL11_06534 [Colletotrichum chlorophyti]|uniref:Uncharacterized protein n=1 Tax=Colletotrichum chlorophyti TaxID=708187 RepID=A0A1Q8RRU2_9PEZI|nr:hypothetical protein CCHL11_06534 [Colletotrichum chlorophyti]
MFSSANSLLASHH